MRDFLLGMHGFGVLSRPSVAAAFDLSGFRRLVDLGGATGHLAVAACERYPDLQAAVFDLPRVVEAAREFVAGGRVDSAPAPGQWRRHRSVPEKRESALVYSNVERADRFHADSPGMGCVAACRRAQAELCGSSRRSRLAGGFCPV